MNGPGIGSWPARRARMNPATVALATDDESLTYAELAARVEATASHLRELGVSAGERVAYLGPNSIDTFVCFFATARLGGVFVSLNTRLAAPEIGYMLQDSGSVVLVHGPECAELAHAADPARARGQARPRRRGPPAGDGRRQRRRCRGRTTSSTSTTRR